jgi:glycosyltransferase involved in cell wall biosynthesis
LLHVYGGSKLWGEEDAPFLLEPGVVDHGMVGQKDLARALMGMGFSIHLQTRQEPFGLSVIESMRRGCIVIASSVGAYPEIITHAFNGFLIPLILKIRWYTDGSRLDPGPFSE